MGSLVHYGVDGVGTTASDLVYLRPWYALFGHFICLTKRRSVSSAWRYFLSISREAIQCRAVTFRKVVIERLRLVRSECQEHLQTSIYFFYVVVAAFKVD